MAGKRLLDAAKLLNAGQTVLKEHIALRQQQWDLYTKTSGLAREVKAQADRVTVTAGAAYKLVKRFNGNGPVWQQDRGSQTEEHGSPGENGTAASYVRSGLEPGTAHSDVDTSQSTRWEQRKSDDGTLASLRRREQQRLFERQIPATSADTQPAQEGNLGQDTFTERSSHVSPELSSLPRAKLPKHIEASADSALEFANRDINQDVYPNPEQAFPSEDQTPEGVDTNVFVSPRVSQLLGSARPRAKDSYASRQRLPPKPLPEMVAASERWAREKESTGTTRQPPEPTPMESATTERVGDIEDLAASIAKDSSSSTHPPSVPSETVPYQMHESRVPSSRFGRIWQYSGLATSMAFGAVGESFRRVVGSGGQGSLMLSEGNLNRLAAKLSRMRGAALKLGQMISFQDSKVLPPAVNAVLQRLQDSADYMPLSQRDKVMARDLGPDWRQLFTSFEDTPFAAASIGQVHRATLKANGEAVAVKVQYPGVKSSIDSDLNNLSLLLTASQLLPKGLFLDRTIANARTELGWECDYKREAEAQIRFKNDLLIDEADTFAVPTVYSEASGEDVLTAEYMHGTAVTKIHDLSEHERDWIGTQILRLCLRELMEWRFMQTDPNWTNFLYNRETKKIELLDFGASREFPDKFVEPYVSLLIAASKGDRDTCQARSIELGYLTGEESTEMLRAHVDSILTLAEPFVDSAPEVYDFEDQTITDRVRANIGLMLHQRLAPPPEETYSLHRKLSGAFLLCARLKSKVPARGLFQQAVKVWNGKVEKVKV